VKELSRGCKYILSKSRYAGALLLTHPSIQSPKLPFFLGFYGRSFVLALEFCYRSAGLGLAPA